MNKLQFFQFSVFQYSNLPSPSNPELEFCYLSELDNAIPASIDSAVAYLNGQLTPQSKLLEPSVPLYQRTNCKLVKALSKPVCKIVNVQAYFLFNLNSNSVRWASRLTRVQIASQLKQATCMETLRTRLLFRTISYTHNFTHNADPLYA